MRLGASLAVALVLFALAAPVGSAAPRPARGLTRIGVLPQPPKD